MSISRTAQRFGWSDTRRQEMHIWQKERKNVGNRWEIHYTRKSRPLVCEIRVLKWTNKEDSSKSTCLCHETKFDRFLEIFQNGKEGEKFLHKMLGKMWKLRNRRTKGSGPQMGITVSMIQLDIFGIRWWYLFWKTRITWETKFVSLPTSLVRSI